MAKVHYTFGESREVYRDSNGYRMEHYRTACGLWLPNDVHYMVFSRDDCDCKRCLSVLDRIVTSGVSEQRYVRRRLGNGQTGVYLLDGSSAPLPDSVDEVVGSAAIAVIDEVVVGDVALKTRHGVLRRERDDL
tara:strand:+ start:334 stop:732 length:399 start_codon:yes stop_codon:yes gene_type:complete